MNSFSSKEYRTACVEIPVNDSTEGEPILEGGGHVGDPDTRVARAHPFAPDLQRLRPLHHHVLLHLRPCRVAPKQQ